jgi:alkylation response protein AidB-like acyl-CoA dehydrogenase
MDFDFSNEDRMVQEQVRRYLHDQCQLTRHRAVVDGDEVQALDVWRGLADMGVQGTAIAEEFGGVGAGYLPLCLAAQEIGAVLAPIPFSSSIYLAAEAVSLYGSTVQKENLLTKLASGEIIATLAVVEDHHEPSADKLNTQFKAGTLTGSKLIVPHGMIAHQAIVVATGDKGPELVIVDLTDVPRTSVQSVDPTLAAARLDFNKTPAEPLGLAGAGWDQLEQLMHRAAVLFAFEQLGGAEQALNMAVAYAKERFAFGRPIGSFQALKHMMADMYVALKLAESNAYYAAWALENNAPDLNLAAATARVSATQAFQLCARDNIQVHGGMGFTWEFDCHLYYRRSNYLTLALGGLTAWENKLIDALPQAVA